MQDRATEGVRTQEGRDLCMRGRNRGGPRAEAPAPSLLQFRFSDHYIRSRLGQGPPGRQCLGSPPHCTR